MPTTPEGLQDKIPQPTLHISLLGGLRLAYGDEAVTRVNTPRLQALLAYLLLHRQTPQSRQQLAFQFWPDSSEKQAHTNLRKLLFQLRNALPDPDQFLDYDHLTIQWRSAAPYTLDVAEIQELAAHAQATSDPTTLAQIVQRYQGELLPGVFDEWLIPIRQQLQREVMAALEQLIHLAEHQREYRVGIRYAQRLLGLDPLHESAHRRLMQLHALNGDRAAALHDYHTCVTLLQQELGVEPDEETRTLYQQLLKVDGQLGQPAAPLVNAPLVGRATNWQTLLATWRRAQRGQAHFVSIAGETGMGKTRLAEELLAWASAQGIRVARTRSYEAEGGLAYAPVTEWLRSSALNLALQTLDKPWLSEVARLMPELLTMYPTIAPPTPLTESWQRQCFFEALARATLAEKGPLLLLIDDLQWCDRETLSWLRYLLRHDPQAKLLLIGTWRSEEVSEAHPLRVLLRDLHNTKQLTSLELASLDAQETVELVQRIAPRQIGLREMQQLYQVTEGHPLFVIEAVRAMGKDHHMLSTKVQSVIQSRLAQLSSAALELVGLAATIGRHFTFTIVAHASQLHEDSLVQALDELWQRRIVREQGTRGYDFTHGRIREVVYQGLSQVRRCLLHRRVAEALEAANAHNLEAVFGQLAVHYEKAQMPEQAFRYWMRIAQQAEMLDAYTEAATYYERGLTLLTTQLTEDVDSRFQLLFLRSAMFERQKQTQKFAADNQTLLALAATMGNPMRLAQAQLRQATYLASVGKHAAALQAGELALSIYQESADKPGEIQALRELGLLCWAAKDYGSALRYGRAVLVLHRQQSDVKGEASALHNLAEIYRGLDSPRQAITLYEQALQLYWVNQDLRRQVITLYSLAFAFRQIGQFERALTCYDQAIKQCEQSGERLILSRIYHALATLDWEQQHPAEAIQKMTQAVTISQTIGYLPGTVHGLVALAYMESRSGRQKNAHQHLTAALAPLHLMDDQAGVSEVEKRLQLLEADTPAMPAPPIHMNWIRTHIVLAEGKVYCEFESTIATHVT